MRVWKYLFFNPQIFYILGIKVYNIPPEIAGLVTLTKRFAYGTINIA